MSQKKICVGLRHLRIKPARRESRPTMGRIQNPEFRSQKGACCRGSQGRVLRRARRI